MKQLVLMIAVALSTLSGKAQPFKITTDTIQLDSIKYRYIGMMTDYHDKYFCVVKPTDEDDERTAIIMIDKHDKTITRLPLPQQWVDEGETRVESMFVRNDSLIIKRHETYEKYMFHYRILDNDKWFNRASTDDIEELEQMERLQDHYLNPVTMKWEPAIRAYDEIYSDKKYVVFTGTDYHELDYTKQYTNAPKIFKVESDSVLFEQMGWEPVTYSKQIRKMYRNKLAIISGFFMKDQLYLLVHSDAGLALTSYHDGTISKEADIFKGYMRPLSRKENSLILKNSLENYQARLMFNDVMMKTFVLVNIDRYDIRLTYFIMS